MKWKLYRTDRERRSVDLTAVYKGLPETLEAPISAVLRVQSVDVGSSTDIAATVTGAGTTKLTIELSIAPDALAVGTYRGWFVVTWADGPRTWPDPESGSPISITVVDRP